MVEPTQTVTEYNQAQGITTPPPAGSTVQDSTVQQAITGPWALLPISGTTTAAQS